MLVLTRNCDEWIDIVTESGERIAVCLLFAKGGRGRLGFEAADGVRIARRELGPPIPLAERIAARKGKG